MQALFSPNAPRPDFHAESSAAGDRQLVPKSAPVSLYRHTLPKEITAATGLGIGDDDGEGSGVVDGVV